MARTGSQHELNIYGEIQLFAGTSCPELAAELSQYVNVPLSGRDIVLYPNENLWIKLHKSVRGQDVYVVQTTCKPVHRNLMELLILLQTMRLDSAGRVTAVIPYLCYARSDKKDKPRVPITARLVADMIEVAGADRYMTMDLHAGQIQGFFSIPGDVLTAFHLLTGYIKTRLPEMNDPVVVAADLGFAKKGRNFAVSINSPIAFIEKRRIGQDNHAEAVTLIGEVKGHDVIIVDDEIDTGGSVDQAVKLVKKEGACDVYLVSVHPVFSPPAPQRLAAMPIKELVVTNTMPIPPEIRELLKDRLTVLSIAPMLGEVILRAHQGRSVGQMFDE